MPSKAAILGMVAVHTSGKCILAVHHAELPYAAIFGLFWPHIILTLPHSTSVALHQWENKHE